MKKKKNAKPSRKPAKRKPRAVVKIRSRGTGIWKHGIHRPSADSASGRVWAIADKLSKKGQPAARAAVIKLGLKFGSYPTVATQYGYWRIFNGIKGWTSRPAKPKAVKSKSSRVVSRTKSKGNSRAKSKVRHTRVRQLAARPAPKRVRPSRAKPKGNVPAPAPAQLVMPPPTPVLAPPPIVVQEPPAVIAPPPAAAV